MSNYVFCPSPTFDIGVSPYVYWENGFNDEEIEKIISIGYSKNFSDGIIGQSGDPKLDKNYRRAKTSWINLQEDSEWLYDRIAYIVRQLNGKYYRFDLYGFNEDMQFTVYEGNDEGFYDWHMDSGVSEMCPRKLSFVLQLSDPSEYEGGELQIMTGHEPETIKKEKGYVAVFPSYMLHRVTPVTKGVRKTLVVWVTGPAFR